MSQFKHQAESRTSKFGTVVVCPTCSTLSFAIQLEALGTTRPRRFASTGCRTHERGKSYHIYNKTASRKFGSYGLRKRRTQPHRHSFRSHRSRSTLTSPYCDTTFTSWLRTNEWDFSGPWLANKTEMRAGSLGESLS